MNATAIIPRATYRLQLHRGFDFFQAIGLLPYLERLGVSHVYCSPIMRAAPGSLHGYDVVDPQEINPELGGRAGFEQLSAAARAQGMGLIIDLVPNHMAVLGVDNRWWGDVLEHGEASRYAHYFDIDWHPADASMHDKILLPVLGSSYGTALDEGSLRVAVTPTDAQRPLAIQYHEHRFPLDPGTWALLLRPSAAFADTTACRAELDTLARDAGAVPGRERRGQSADRSTRVAPLKARLLTLLREDAHAAAAIERYAAWLASADGRDDLHALLEAQAYRLAHWRVAADDINYRRFFDVNSLAALRVEDEDVFEATHALALELTAAGLADGVRIDHPDGLHDPKQYFERLQRGHARRAGLPVDDTMTAATLPLFVVAEKIAAAHEDVPADWALHGTTGYRFANVVTGLFVDQRQQDRCERIWRAASGVSEPYAEIALAARGQAATSALASELTTLAGLLTQVAASNRHWRDHGRQTLRHAIAEVAAAMPVYRTYVVDQPSAQDRVFIDWAVAGARARTQLGDPEVFAMLHACLLLELPPEASPRARAAARRFVGRFQQFCAPVAAKGIEDTAFYRYHRLVSLNDVGGDPATFGVSVKAFHGASADRALHWPHTLLATSTHDNKRSEDVRHRISALSEFAPSWRLGLRRWKRLTRSLHREVNGRVAPSPRDEVLLYQTLVGSLPTEVLDEAALTRYRERIGAYMLKAAREAKLDTRWARPDTAYETALAGFIDGLLGRLDKNPALDDLRQLAGDLAWFGGLNSVSSALIKFASPGVPDLYQGNEIVDLSLVDPDNRRAVDYALRTRWLAEMEALWQRGDATPTLQGWAQHPADGRLKLWTLWRLLALRRECPALFGDGRYVPLPVSGAGRHHIVAFARQHGGETLVVVATRLVATLMHRTRALPLGACWGNTSIDLSALRDRRMMGDASDVLGGGALTWHEARLDVSTLLSTLPIAAIRISEASR